MLRSFGSRLPGNCLMAKRVATQIHRLMPLSGRHASATQARRALAVSSPPAGRHVDPTCMFGIRSVDPVEREALNRAGVTVHNMQTIDQYGIAPLLRAFLSRVAAENGIQCKFRRRSPRPVDRTRRRGRRTRAGRHKLPRGASGEPPPR